jgi:hypothetical protein
MDNCGQADPRDEMARQIFRRIARRSRHLPTRYATIAMFQEDSQGERAHAADDRRLRGEQVPGLRA